jgi:predicted phage-related endonuclease
MTSKNEPNKFDRTKGIGGSDATKLVAGEWRDLYLEKKGLKESDDLSFVLPVQLGIYTEPFNRDWFAAHNDGLYVQESDDVLYHKDYDYIYANLDGFVLDDNFKKQGVFEAKHVHPFTKDETLLEKYYGQIQHYMMVTKLPRSWLSVLFGNSKYKAFVIEKDKKFQDKLLNAERRFWQHIQEEDEPPAHVDIDEIGGLHD